MPFLLKKDCRREPERNLPAIWKESFPHIRMDSKGCCECLWSLKESNLHQICLSVTMNGATLFFMNACTISYFNSHRAIAMFSFPFMRTFYRLRIIGSSCWNFFREAVFINLLCKTMGG